MPETRSQFLPEPQIDTWIYGEAVLGGRCKVLPLKLGLIERNNPGRDAAAAQPDQRR